MSQLDFTAEESRPFSEFRLQAERLICATQKSGVKQSLDTVESELGTVVGLLEKTMPGLYSVVI